MKNLRIPALCLCALLLSLVGSAQTTTNPVSGQDDNKPKLFSNLPDKIPVTNDQINALFDVQVGVSASLSLSANETKKFTGNVVSKANSNEKEGSLESVVVRSSNFNGATLTISKLISKDGTVSYVGRIISFQHGDVYELQNLNGTYTLVKRGFSDLVNE